MKYIGIRKNGRAIVYKVDGNKSMILDPRFDLICHSPTGFEWGYGGSGPAQLALAILADFLGNDHLALKLYQFFKNDVITKLPYEGWILEEDEIRRWIRWIYNMLAVCPGLKE